MKKKNLSVSIIILIFVLILGGFLAYGYYQKYTYKIKRPIVSMEIKDYGVVKIELYPDVAPNTVKTFIKLINDNYYNGLTIHRVEENLLQGGQRKDEPKISIDGEFTKNNYQNDMKFERGTLGLARQDYTYFSSMDPTIIKKGYNSGYAQFFIMTQKEEYFDGYYTAFGKVIEGMEIVDKITKTETKVEKNKETGEDIKTSSPVNEPIISKMSVDTFGIDYGIPKTHEAFDINSWFIDKYQRMNNN